MNKGNIYENKFITLLHLLVLIDSESGVLAGLALGKLLNFCASVYLHIKWG